MLLHDAFGDGEPEAGALRLCGEKRFKQMPLSFGGDTWSGISHAEQEAGLFGKFCAGTLRIARHQICGGKDQGALGAHGFHRVDQEV